MKLFTLHSLLSAVFTYLFFSYSTLLPFNATTAMLVVILLFAILWLLSVLYHPAYFRKLPKALSLLLYFLKEMFVANIKIAFDIITPRLYMRPTVIAYPLLAKTDLEISLLACMITLTPGTLSLDVSEDKQTLYIHALYLGKDGEEGLIQSLRTGFEHRILALTT
jgi:multicomponent Na+:H+ antiporter subunit E